MACLLRQRKECRDISERWIVYDLSRPRSGEQSTRDIVREARTAVISLRQAGHRATEILKGKDRADFNKQIWDWQSTNNVSVKKANHHPRRRIRYTKTDHRSCDTVRSRTSCRRSSNGLAVH